MIRTRVLLWRMLTSTTFRTPRRRAASPIWNSGRSCSAGRRDLFETPGDFDAVTKDLLAVMQNIADMNTHPQADRVCGGTLQGEYSVEGIASRRPSP